MSPHRVQQVPSSTYSTQTGIEYFEELDLATPQSSDRRSVYYFVGTLAIALALIGVACVSSEKTPTSSPPTSTPVADGEVGLSENAPPVSVPSKGPPPPVDTNIHSVPLEDVVFDTFNGSFVRLSDGTPQLIERFRDVIRPIHEPRYEGPEGGIWLRDDDLIIGYERETSAYAYPIKMLNSHEIVNDVIGGSPVLISYCPLCASSVAFSREVNGMVLVFGNTSALF